ncbi:MAG: hypothetical protein KC983_01110 [Phycisphaerales bacterium]|nr:hypothetical protein [Phycisphaerales bacterium]
MTDASHRIRFVGADDDVLSKWARERQAREAVLAENRRAATSPDLDPTDPRWVLAVRVRSALQGSTLTPERRSKIQREAWHLGIRPFDANMIIAIVQDRARRGESINSSNVALQLLGTPAPPESAATSAWRWGLAFLCAVAANAFLIWWLDLL